MKAVLFDWDDTLSYNEPHYLEVLERALSAHGLTIDRGRLIRAWAAASRDPDPGWTARLPALLAIEDQAELVSALMRGIKERSRIRQRRLFPDVSGSLWYLRSLGLRVGVLSDNWNVRRLVEEYSLAPLLDAVITPLISGALKPDPATFRVALSVLGVDAAECLYVGDAYEVDVLGARAAGLDCLLIDRWGIDEDVDCPRARDLDGVLLYIAERRYGASVSTAS